ncbi:histone-lysine N-methyltransferase SETMAR [Trichonephila clavipes]|nr:histone-lysine N-methyltransferase SETMAR [Trichonephila clavipes]
MWAKAYCVHLSIRDYLALSPDLTPSDFHLFLHPKSFLAGKHFNNDKELKENVSNWLKPQAATFYEEGIEKLVPRYDTCLQNFGSYVERREWGHQVLSSALDHSTKLQGPYPLFCFRVQQNYFSINPSNLELRPWLPSDYGHELVASVDESRVRNIESLKTRRVEGLMHLKFVEAKNPPVVIGLKVREEGFQIQCHPRHLTMTQNYEVHHQ